MRQDVDLTDFSGGELSPKLKGRTDLKKYFSACSTLLNMVVMPQGGATKRPPTRYVANNKNQTGINRPVRFVFSTVQAYVLEFSNANARVYMNGGVVLNAGNPVDIALPYTSADIPSLKFTQSADTLYIFHPSYRTATLTRSSHVSWSFGYLTLRDGPYLPVNTTATTLTPSGTSGSITIVASGVTGINGGQGFLSTDIGRAIRLKLYSLWAWAVITGVSDTVTVTATVQGDTLFGAADAIDGNAWAVSTDYVTGAVVTAGSGKYIAVAGGRSAGSGSGPSGTGNQILDGTVVWKMVGGFASTAWATNTEYDTGVVVLAGGNYYQCTVAGKSSGGGSGPTGTGGAITDGTVTWAYIPPFSFPTATADWRLGSISATTGYPAAGTFWQERLQLAAPASLPNRIDASVTADFTNFAPSAADGTVTDANALSWTLDDDEVNAIHGLSAAGSSQSMQLALFTGGGEHVLQAATSAQALTPSSVQAYRETSYGSAANVGTLRIGKVVLFTDRPGLKLREFSFYWQSNGYVAPDILQFSEHMTRAPAGSVPSLSGIRWWAYQQTPHQVIWAGLNNGKLISFTYDRDQQVFAPAQHQLGGNFYGGPPVVEFGTVIPSPDGTHDQLWLTVLRTINGAEVRFMELMAPYFDAGDPDQAIFADASLVTTSTKPAATLSITGLTANSPVDVQPETMPPYFTGSGTFTTNADAFSASDVTNKAIIRVNGGKVLVTGYTNARNITGQVLRPLQSQAPAASGAWSKNARFSSVTGLSHLNGEPVAIVGDGAYLGTKTVVAGAVPLDTAATLAGAGLAYTPVIITMPFEPVRAAIASSQGKLKRIDTMWVRFHETLGASFGRRLTDAMTEVIYDKVEPMQSRSAADAMDNAPALFSGAKKFNPQGGHDREGQIIITQQEPLPMTVLGVFARGEVSELAR